MEDGVFFVGFGILVIPIILVIGLIKPDIYKGFFQKPSRTKFSLVMIGLSLFIIFLGISQMPKDKILQTDIELKKQEKTTYPDKDDSIVEESEKNVPKTVYNNLVGPPSNNWVGKTIAVKFGEGWPKTLANLEVTVKLISVETDPEGYKFFKTDKVYSDKDHDFLFFSWFDTSSAPHLLSYKEVVTQP